VDEGRGEAVLYEDAGDGYAHRDGDYARTRIVCEGSPETLTVSVGKREGAFTPARSQMSLELRGLGREPEAVEVDDRAVGYEWDPDTDTLTVALDDDASGHRLTVRRNGAA